MTNAEANNFKVLETKDGANEIEFQFCTYRNEYAMLVIDKPSGELVTRFNGPEAIIKKRYDEAK